MKTTFKKLALATLIPTLSLMMAGCNNDDDNDEVVTPPDPISGEELKSDQIAIYYKCS